jgi:hypothetical protein
MGMPSHPSSKTLVIWIVLISVSYLVASCGDDNEKTVSTPSDVVEKAPQTQQPIVREWYPRPKYPPPPTTYIPAPPTSAPSTGQPQPYYPGGAYQQPQMMEQTPPQSSTWNQSGQSQDIPQQYQTGPQYQTPQRPWGEFPPLEKKKKSTTREEQRPVTIPYGGWPGYYGGYSPGYYGGYGGYGYGLYDPLLGTPGLGGGIYNAYPEMIPPLYGW